MPGVEDWVNRPLEVVDRIFDQYGENCHEKVVDYFVKRLKETEALHLVPSLNDVPLHQLNSNGLIRFRCMIQDMFNTEFYLKTYAVVDRQNCCRLKCGMYKDVMDCKPVEEVDMNSSRNKMADRMLYYCVSIPGENSWVKQGFCHSESAAIPCSSSTHCGGLKRTLEDDNDDIEMVDGEMVNEHKKSCPEVPSSGKTSEKSIASLSENLNFPLPNVEGVACLVKLYGGTEHLKVTDVVEFIGVLSVDPQLEYTKVKFDCNDDEEMEIAAHNPPPSLVPRLHAITITSLLHNVPYLPAEVKLSDNSAATEILSQAKRIREELIKILAEALLGDVLAAEYLLFHLISSIYFRQDVTVLGKFCLNLINFPLEEGYAKGLYSLLQKFLAKSHFLELSLENLNSRPFSPWKDYTSDRLISGILQLSPQTHLIVDETALSAGQLESKGVQNIAALKNLIKWQNVEYDYKFNKISYQCNVGVLVLSEGNSLLGSDCQVKLSPCFVPENLKMHLSNLENKLDDNTLKQIRMYLTLLKLARCNLEEEISKIVEDDFVAMRKENSKINACDLHLLLVLGRFQSLSVGEITLTKESWEKVKRMEAERKSRIPYNASA